ncbi:FecR domain-containing protein [Microvirga lenta]|uniref:FecR domain-containing protein n=1 Tax=Microvirga lenta TaxID=2881337 RepID=UPI001CFEFAD4|nr:FecR domain-containing protein [Microvirga lenta]MCB5174544.1 FecR domain-containing protein [Microvirga lenta]
MHACSLRFLVATSAMALSLAAAQAQSPVPRAAPPAGSIVAAKGGEELRFTREETWRAAEIRQDLLGGDVLRTNTIGNLAILFADQTQIRVGRNSTLTVNDVAGPGNGATQLNLQAGNIWARANRGGTGVDVKTPAAVAAIRGTDWSLSVDGSGKTSLIVLEGVVELSNPQGSVTVRQGEGAVAAIGQAPTKFILVRPNDREQMLFYLTLRDGFTWLPASPLRGAARRAERARVLAIPPEARRVEDWLNLAEVTITNANRRIATEALAQVRQHRLTASQRARADLVEGLIAGRERRWSDAVALLARAERGVDSTRRVTAAYGRYIAASLADPKRALTEPRTGRSSADAALANAFVAGFKQDLNVAAELAKQAEKQFPNDTRLAIFSAQLSLALNRHDEMRASVERARSVDPGDHLVLAMSGRIKADLESDRKGALADLYRAAEAAPGNADIWNEIGMVQAELDAPLEAEAAFRKAIEADPEDPIAYGNLAIHLLDQSRVEEAGALVEKALDLDPEFHVAYIARGRYLLQKGDLPGAIESILAGSAANPAYSNGLVAAAVAYYQNGEVELADQALDNANRLDLNDPVTSIVRTAIALDQYRADDAVRFAREAVKRSRARGGDYAGLSANRQSGSYPADAYRFIGLHEWGRFYGDRTFDPFASSSYFDQAANVRANVLSGEPSLSSVETGADPGLSAFNLIVQGLLLDPLAAGGRIGRIDLLRRPFLDAEIGGSIISQEGRIGWQSTATVNGFSNEPVPTAFSFTAGRLRANGPYSFDDERLDNAALFIGAAPSAADRFLAFGTLARLEPGSITLEFPTQATAAMRDTTEYQLGAGWSHTFGYRNVLTAAVFAARSEDRIGEQIVGFDENLSLVELLQNRRTRSNATLFALSHMFGLDNLTFRYGAEGFVGETKAQVDRRLNGVVLPAEGGDASFDGGRLYADAFWRPNDWFEAQAGIEGLSLDIENEPSDMYALPRVGIGVSPFEGHWLRAAYRSDVSLPATSTLAPLTTVGLLPNALPVGVGGRTDTLALRWDAEWSDRFFTSVEYQRQDVTSLSLPIPESFDTIPIDEAKIERVAATANLWLGHGIGVFGTVGAASSEIRSGNVYGLPVPYVAERFARAGVTFVHPSRLKVTLAQTFLGDIAGNIAGAPLDDYWTTDASVTWETPDRRLLLGVTVLNLFDRGYELAPSIPGPGRTVAASIKARF